MLFPSKITKVKDTTVYKSTFIVKKILEGNLEIGDLYNATKRHFTDLNEFRDAVTILWVLNYIDFDVETGDIKYAKED